ncbi:hypothetical protein D3C87_1251670 [compost metagenome]
MDIILPDWYDDLFEFECAAKGAVLNLEVAAGDYKRTFNFYDISRFSQEAKDEIQECGYFRDEAAVIIHEVTRENIIKYLISLNWN